MVKKLLMDILFPVHCVRCKKLGNYICSNCFAYISLDVRYICPLCNRGSLIGRSHDNCRKSYRIDGLIPCVSYGSVAKKLTYQLKYKPHVSALSGIISELMIEALEQNEQFHRLIQTNPLFVPVPLYRSRERTRGYNHAALLASHVAQYFKSDYDPRILTRMRNTKPQFKLDREERMKNIQDAFAISEDKKFSIKNRNIILVDDIATTCSTLAECAKVLKKNGAGEVWGVVFTREG